MACNEPEVSYETYVQVSNADSPDAKYVLVLVKNPESKVGEPDSSLATFTLKDQEKKSETKRNKYFPDSTYLFDAELDQGLLKVKVTVKHRDSIVFQSSQTFSGSTIPTKNM